MTKLKGRVNLMVHNASPGNLITAHFPQIGVIPNIILNVAPEFVTLREEKTEAAR